MDDDGNYGDDKNGTTDISNVIVIVIIIVFQKRHWREKSFQKKRPFCSYRQ